MTIKERFVQAQNKDNRARVSADPDRLHYHLMPPVGWLNDPNGLYEKDGVYHIFYQYSPMNADGTDKKGWGHYATRDFVHFTEEDDALFPDSVCDAGGAYSGSAFKTKDGTVHFFYTGNDKIPGDYDYINAGRQHWVVHFTTQDGRKFSEKEVLLKNADYPANLSCHVRDPKVIEEDGVYYMVLGARTRDSVGQVNVFRSTDLKDWKPVSAIKTEKPFGYMWECPDLFDLDGRRLLITCPQGVDRDGYYYENIYQNGYFFVDGPLDADQTVGNFQELDNGFDFYAPQTFEDENGRRILIGWMGIPDADYTNPTVKNGWQHALTLPRELRVKNGRLFQYPIRETELLRGEQTIFSLEPGKTLCLPGPVCEVELRPQGKAFEILFRKDAQLSFKDGLLTLSLGQSGSGRNERHADVGSVEQITIFSDTSSLEIFINGGERVFTTRLYDGAASFDLTSDVPVDGVAYALKPYQIQTRQDA